MADANPQSLGKYLTTFTSLPVQRQLGLLIGVAMVVALVVALALWGLRPTYRPLLPGMAKKDVAEAMDALAKKGVKYRIDPNTGTLMVPAENVQKARLYLATQGLPRQNGVGFELLDKKGGIGMSRLEETIRYQRALEGELARTIATLDGVDSARVHLALPRDSVFIRNSAKPAASVLIDLHPGRTVDDRQIAGIVHLVASSVPNLEADRVTVVDQRGRLLTTPDSDSSVEVSSRQLDYTRKLEDTLRKRVDDILAPIVGKQGAQVQVTAQVSFRKVETTQENYDPKKTALLSEQVSQSQSVGGGPQGVPGSLSNEPPAAAEVATPPAQTPAGVAGTAAAATTQKAQTPLTRHSSATRNYEVDRTISHIQEAPATLQRLSVAVVVDYAKKAGKDGKIEEVPRTAEQMAHLTTLVQKAVGFDAARGDSVNVINAPFQEAAPIAPLPPVPLWKQIWAQQLVKQVLAGLGVLLLVLLVLRPTLRSLARAPLLPAARPALAGPGDDGVTVSIGADSGAGKPPAPPVNTLENGLDNARQLTQDDPRLVAQVVRTWMKTDE